MAEKNIEMNVMNESGGYDVLYPKNISDITLNSEYLKDLFNLSENSNVDDAFDYVSRKIILLQYNKAGVSVILKSQAGTPIPNIPILGITANYDGSGECITDENGTCFGYCDAGSVNIHCNTYVDMSINNQQLSVLASEMYNVELMASNFVNFKSWTSTTNNIRFSNNVSRVDVSCGGGGGGGSSSYSTSSGGMGGGGGGGGYCMVQENVDFLTDQIYQCIVGSGGVPNGVSDTTDATAGGTSSFLGITGKGGEGGEIGNYSNNIAGVGGTGNGNGGNGSSRGSTNGRNGTAGNQQRYSSFVDMIDYGGGGGGGNATSSIGQFQTNGGGYGGKGGLINKRNNNVAGVSNGENGENGYGGGGGGGSYVEWRDMDDYDMFDGSAGGRGGSGCVAIRIHLKITA